MEQFEFNEKKSKEMAIEQYKESKKRSNRKLIRRSKRYKEKKNSYYNELKRTRYSIRRKIFKEFDFGKEKKVVEVDGEVGLEDIKYINNFIKLAQDTIDSNSADLIIDLKKCTRLWPSAITLLCSLKKWTELASMVNKANHPMIRSTVPEKNDVENYLYHCGFYKYVANIEEERKNIFSDNEIVKIKREADRSKIILHEVELDRLIIEHSTLTDEQYELFTCKVLIEVINNVTEHGVTCHDQGWWILGQYHKAHKLISICIADNGIGFRNNLVSGPQKEEILERIENVPQNESDFIYMAFKENVSGAYNASTKDEGVLLKRYSQGARRGHGLKRILSTCKECQVQLSVFSHFGYVIFDNEGEMLSKGSSGTRLFAGTLYHLTIPAK